MYEYARQNVGKEGEKKKIILHSVFDVLEILTRNLKKKRIKNKKGTNVNKIENKIKENGVR